MLESETNLSEFVGFQPAVSTSYFPDSYSFRGLKQSLMKSAVFTTTQLCTELYLVSPMSTGPQRRPLQFASYDQLQHIHVKIQKGAMVYRNNKKWRITFSFPSHFSAPAHIRSYVFWQTNLVS